MKITQITVSYGATQSLPEYSNVKPNLTITATIDDGEAFEAVEAELWALAKSHVHEQIDAALEASGKAARYDPCERYQVLRTYRDYHAPKDAPQQLYVVILPNEVTLDEETNVRWVSPSFYDTRKVRLSHARQMADEVVTQDGAILIDCSDGDLSRLAVAMPPQQTAPEHLEDTLDYSEQDPESEWEQEEAEEGDDLDLEPRDFVAESMVRVENRHNQPSDDGPDNSM